MDGRSLGGSLGGWAEPGAAGAVPSGGTSSGWAELMLGRWSLWLVGGEWVELVWVGGIWWSLSWVDGAGAGLAARFSARTRWAVPVLGGGARGWGNGPWAALRARHVWGPGNVGGIGVG